MEFTGICLITNDVAKMREFYERILGVEGEGDSIHADLKTKGGNISIFSMNGMEKMAPHCMHGAGNGSFTISFKVENVDQEYERLKALGVDFVMLPTTHPWGARSVWFRDTDRNIVNFYCWIEQ